MLDLDLEHGEQYSVGFFFSRSGKKKTGSILPTTYVFAKTPFFNVPPRKKKCRTPLEYGCCYCKFSGLVFGI